MKPFDFPSRISISDRFIGEGTEPFVIAELCGNHQQSLELAERMIETVVDFLEGLNVSVYNMNLATMADMKNRYVCPIGLSDHSDGIGISLAATTIGGCVIEKHFVLSRVDGGVDAAFSIEPDELEALCVQSKRIQQAVGTINYGDNESDKEALRYRRSIFIGQSIREDEVITEQHLKVVRPASGLHPRHYEELLGKRALRDLVFGEPATMDMFG